MSGHRRWTDPCDGEADDAEKRLKDADTGYAIARRGPRRRRDGAPPPSRAGEAHQPSGAVIIDWPWGKPGYGTTIQRNCQTAPSDKWKVPLGGVCINRTAISREGQRFNVERAFAGRCTSTYACKKFVENGACAEAADAVLAQCKCRRMLTTKFGEVCVERCCARRRKKGRKGGPHLMGWLHRKKRHPKSFRVRSARGVH